MEGIARGKCSRTAALTKVHYDSEEVGKTRGLERYEMWQIAERPLDAWRTIADGDAAQRSSGSVAELQSV
jgi:hypothetical protein